MDDPQIERTRMNEENGEYIDGIWVAIDPMDLLQCESCQ